MLAATLLIGAIALVAHGMWRGPSVAAVVARWVRGASGERPRAALGWAAGIGAMYGVTSLVALALLGRIDAIGFLPPELGAAGNRLGIESILGAGLWEIVAAIGGGFAIGAIVAVISVRRGWRTIGPSYRSPAIARTRGEIGAALILSLAAGVGEELFFRLLVPLLAAIVFGNGVIGCAIGWALFVLVHRYQGRGGMAAVALVGAVLAWLYLATGLLWVVVALHTAVDVNSLVLRPWLERRLRAA